MDSLGLIQHLVAPCSPLPLLLSFHFNQAQHLTPDSEVLYGMVISSHNHIRLHLTINPFSLPIMILFIWSNTDPWPEFQIIWDFSFQWFPVSFMSILLFLHCEAQKWNRPLSGIFSNSYCVGRTSAKSIVSEEVSNLKNMRDSVWSFGHFLFWYFS